MVNAFGAEASPQHVEEDHPPRHASARSAGGRSTLWVGDLLGAAEDQGNGRAGGRNGRFWRCICGGRAEGAMAVFETKTPSPEPRGAMTGFA